MVKLNSTFRISIAIVLLISAIVVMILFIFRPQPIQIVLETGQEVASKSSDYFSIVTVVILLICAFFTGAAITYLFYNSEDKKIFSRSEKSEKEYRGKENNDFYSRIIFLLKDDEKHAVHIIKEHKGEILQNELVLKLGLSKVKTTRILASLERKQIIERHRHGMTNKIKFKDM